MNSWSILILLLILIPYFLELVIEILDLKHSKAELPDEVKDVYDEEEYKKSLAYHKENTYFDFLAGFIALVFMLVVIFMGGFAYLDEKAKLLSTGYGELVYGVMFAVLFFSCSYVIGLPGTLYKTFVIEEKYGFNKTTLKLWLIDQLKGMVLGVVIGLPFLALILKIFSYAKENPQAWLVAWVSVLVFQTIMMFLSPVLMSLFNKFEPLKDNELKELIENYAKNYSFTLSGIFQMDGSKRSSKANAFFAGFGKLKKIVLFDTLIEKLTRNELLVVLAHEMGHFKCKHIYKLLVFGGLTMGLMLFCVQQLLSLEPLYKVFGLESSVHACLIIVSSIVLTPLTLVLGLIKNYYSRKYEYEADAFAVQTTKDGEGLVQALKKLSQSNLSNLTPHPVKTFFEYSHPTVVQRIRAIRSIEIKGN